MPSASHSWNASRRMSHWFFLGMVTAFSLTLVAFEWRMPRSEVVIRTALDDDSLPTEVLPVVILKKAGTSSASTKQRSRTRIVIADPDPILTNVPNPSPTPEPIAVTGTAPDPTSLFPPEPVSYTPLSWGTVGVRPYFMDCLKRDPKNIETCTEQRIGDHLQRHFRIPPKMRGQVRTTVTFEIDATGQVGKVICAPRVDEAVLAEVERVVRSMPQFVPGSQAGYPVPVYYQIPLNLRTQ